ncbi:hypothetical protein [Pseudoalteromonas viridis]|uniref:Flagellar protein FliT n=1 Tax=Pseudoalteromonas viridis TaxID=339617 RepID=A0ABX7V397_9GAMM|nr:hypothetical protein [Pseudoalteromonas viridis]QTL34217.1 hypothetical protein J5X90_11620 [Pseudoalteromonas viridis]
MLDDLLELTKEVKNIEQSVEQGEYQVAYEHAQKVHAGLVQLLPAQGELPPSDVESFVAVYDELTRLTQLALLRQQKVKKELQNTLSNNKAVKAYKSV